MRTEGNCGRGGRDYTGAESVLDGLLSTDHADRVEPTDDDLEDDDGVKRCEHGVPLWQITRCPHCVWMFGAEKK